MTSYFFPPKASGTSSWEALTCSEHVLVGTLSPVATVSASHFSNWKVSGAFLYFSGVIPK